MGEGVAIGVVGLVLVGCGVGSRYETMKVRWRRVTLVEALAEPERAPVERERIETVIAARAFAAALGLDVGEHFGTLSAIERDHPGYVLTAAEELALRPYLWREEPVGARSGKAFLERHEAEDEAARLARAGYDTHVRAATTFRSFPGLPIPLLEADLRRGPVALARRVLREIYRDTVALPGGAATGFGDSLASFVGHRGAIALFAGPPEQAERLRQARIAWQAERRYAAYLERLAGALARAYAQPGADSARDAKRRFFRAARADLRALSEHYEALGVRRLRAPRNNAALLYELERTRGLDLFEAVHERTRDLRRTLDVVEGVARTRGGDPFLAVRSVLAGPGPAATSATPEPAAAPSPGRPSGSPGRLMLQSPGQTAASAPPEAPPTPASPSPAGPSGTPASTVPTDPAPPTPAS